MRVHLLAAACAACLAVPVGAMAQDQPTGLAPDAPSASNLKGPPNANGYGQDNGRSGAAASKDDTPSASNLKGPPNANGYQKP